MIQLIASVLVFIFSIFSHTVSVRKLFDDESPLGLLLQWTLDPHVDVGGKAGESLHKEHFNATLLVKRIVLQENETGDIEVRFTSAAVNCMNQDSARAE